MIYKAFPCIIKHHGSLKYLKYFLSISRQKGSKPKSSSAKILAASSASSVKPNPVEPDNEKYSKTKNVTGKENAYIISSASKSAVEEDGTLTRDRIDDVHPHLKPVAEPDVTARLKENVGNTESEAVKLLNTIKPTDLDWQKQAINIRLLPKYYRSLSKFRLTGLVVITTLAGYGMAPGVFDPVTLFSIVLGTGLTSAAANATNQVLEVPYDSQMARTKNRVLIRGVITPLHASTFALCSASLGLTLLYFGTNTLTAVLGVTNLVLYTSIYTPLKRHSIANTWVGSIVGAIPPLMGWAACTGTLNAGALLMGAILYSWQFPHFNALSWNLRADYSKAGYRMTSVIDPDLCCRVALRHSIALLLLCSAAPLTDLTTWTFAFDSFPLNCYLIYCAWNFYKKADKESSRKLFRLSLLYLPALMFLMFIGKKHSSKNDEPEIKS